MTNDQTRRKTAKSRSSFGLRVSFELLVSSFGFSTKELPMPGSLLKAARKSRRRTNSVFNNPPRTVAIKVTGASTTGAVLTVTYDQPVSLNGVPQYTTDIVGATAVSAVMTGMNTIAITFGSTVATATEVRIPYEEPAVRNGSGGFV